MTDANVHLSPSDNPWEGCLDRLKAYAAERKLHVSTGNGVVELWARGGLGGTISLFTRRSSDSLDAAAGYIINTLSWLGVEVP